MAITRIRKDTTPTVSTSMVTPDTIDTTNLTAHQGSTPAQAKKPKTTHTKRRPYDRANLLKPGRLKTGEMLDLYNVTHSTFYVHRSKGLVPPPDGHIMSRPYWLTSTVAPHFVGHTQAKG